MPNAQPMPAQIVAAWRCPCRAQRLAQGGRPRSAQRPRESVALGWLDAQAHDFVVEAFAREAQGGVGRLHLALVAGQLLFDQAFFKSRHAWGEV